MNRRRRKVRRAEAPRLRRRLALIAGLLVVSYAGLVARAIQLQAIDAEWLADRAHRQHRSTVRLEGLRGSIFDRHGEPLALSSEVASVAASPRRIDDPQATASRLASALGLKTSGLSTRLTANRSFVWIKRWVTPDQAEQIRRLDLAGVRVLLERRRLYPNRELGAPYVGFAGRDEVGLSGLELAFDGALSGAPRALPALRDARGRRLVAWDDAPATRGVHLTLSLDSRLQHASERALDRALERTGAIHGTLVVVDPRSGDLLTVAERPAFDPNRFWEEPTHRFRARAFTDPFEPGSTLKPFLFALAFESGVIKASDPIDCEQGAWDVADRVIHDWKPHGILEASDVLVHSSNIGAAKIGAKLGAKRLVEGLRRFGFGQRTGAGFPGESAGVIRDLRSAQTVELSTLAFGQGMSTTPIQLAMAGAILGNGGHRVSPRTALQIEGPKGRFEWPSGRGERVIPRRTADRVLALLHGAVERGTGRSARVEGLEVAGKTGTAQKAVVGGYSQERFTASFLGFVPAHRPRLVIVVVLDEPRHPHTGGGAAAPVFREIAAYATRHLGIAAGGAE